MALLRGALIACAAYLLYFYGLSRVGLIGPDEPRYAAIGRRMAASGDWVTPVLWGDRWFEKPALLYWMTGAGFRLGLGPETAPRLPVALLSVCFLAFFYWILRCLFGLREALLGVVLLGTSAGWLAYSFVSVTDLPLAACFSAAMLLALLWLRQGGRALLAAAGALLGFAVLAKGLVPLALAAPFLWFGRKQWREWWIPALSSLAVAAPWYLACYARNGRPFLEDFFWKHHFSRYGSEALQHVQPFWFYLPVLIAAVFPWSPVLALLFRRRLYSECSTQFLLAWLGFGLVFFSLSVNKLPGYLLPLLPALCALMGVALARAARAHVVLAATVLLLGLLPGIEHVLPSALEEGLSRSPWRDAPWWMALAAVPGAWLVWRLEAHGRRAVLVLGCAALMVVAVAYLKWKVLPVVDEHSTARPLARQVAGKTCLEPVPRALRYGLNYYTGSPIPDCEE